MKKLLLPVLLLILAEISFQRCANPGSPTGGPKDTIPPTILLANPITGTTQFSGNIIELEFSEFINADKLKQQLIITPRTEVKYKSIVKRNKLVIKLEEDLEDSTTYNFNFADGVTDITEKNPVVNLSIAFSTGEYIDSMSVTGKVEELLTQEPGSGYLVGLYPLTDTLDYFKENPLYFATANDSGEFQMNYLKEGSYKIIAFNDDNRNLILDPETESHGFLEDTIRLDSNLVLRPIRCVLQNVKPLKLINSRPIGPYVEVKYNKTIDSYNVYPKELFHNIIGENKDVIRLYKPYSVAYSDSITSYVAASDSLGNGVYDTLNFAFLESNRKPSSFSFNFNTNTLPLEEELLMKIKFNKPVFNTNLDQILIKADSLSSVRPTVDTTWSFNYTSLELKANYSLADLDSGTLIMIPDSIKLDSLGKTIDNIQRRVPISILFDKGTFISIEQDTSIQKSIEIRKKKIEAGGQLDITISTDQPRFFIQLMKNDKVAYQSADQKQTSFFNVSPGKYIIRVLIDSNQDGKWSFGNLLKNEEPEEVILFGETEVRENWILTPSISF